MDRQKRKTRGAIFSAFVKLLSKKDYAQITVGEIIEEADIGRATFYAHFETKDFLLKELCEELFCHIFDAANNEFTHQHIFDCDAPNSVFLHLFLHIQKNDNNLLELLASGNNELFLKYFKNNLKKLTITQLPLIESRKSEILPEDFWINHITSTFVETLKWWVDNGMKETPETITEYFFHAV